MGGVSEKFPEECTRGLSREQPFHSKPPFGFGRMVSTLWNLHLENDGFSEAAMGWTRGLCIQLASIRKRGPGKRVFPGLRAWSGPQSFGAVAQLGERLICIQEVAGSIPTSSTRCWQAATSGPVAQMARAHP